MYAVSAGSVQHEKCPTPRLRFYTVKVAETEIVQHGKCPTRPRRVYAGALLDVRFCRFSASKRKVRNTPRKVSNLFGVCSLWCFFRRTDLV